MEKGVRGESWKKGKGEKEEDERRVTEGIERVRGTR